MNTSLIVSRYASLNVNYMTIPVYVVGAFSLVTIVYFSDKLKRRGVFIMGCCIPVALGYLICVATPNPHAGYAGMFILVLGKLNSHSHSLTTLV
jgi:MFS family permease